MSDDCVCEDDSGLETGWMPYYVGVKVIQAVPMTQEHYARHKNIPTYMENQPGYLVRYSDGYESWSPAVAFEEAYHRQPSKEEAESKASAAKAMFCVEGKAEK